MTTLDCKDIRSYQSLKVQMKERSIVCTSICCLVIPGDFKSGTIKPLTKSRKTKKGPIKLQKELLKLKNRTLSQRVKKVKESSKLPVA